nr:hypothetical protein [Mesorhizobium sp.]
MESRRRSAGKLLAEAITGDASRLDLFSTLSPLPFHGGTALRGPLYVPGILWHSVTASNIECRQWQFLTRRIKPAQ